MIPEIYEVWHIYSALEQAFPFLMKEANSIGDQLQQFRKPQLAFSAKK